MNELQIFNNEEFGEVKNIEKANKGKHTGFFYILEYGNLVKIGSTKNPYQRIMSLKRGAETYGNLKLGKVAISKPHTNYVSNEKRLHKLFSELRKSGSELFDISFDEAIRQIGDIEYLNESKEIEAKSENFLNGMKSFILGGN